MGTRHLSRQIVLQALYEWDFTKKKKDLKEIVKRDFEKFGFGLKDESFVFELAEGIEKNWEKIDEILKEAAPKWEIEKMNIVDRNILRLGIFELVFGNEKAVPPKVAIDEAVELAKEFSTESAKNFVNGVLAEVFKKLKELKQKYGVSAFQNQN